MQRLAHAEEAQKGDAYGTFRGRSRPKSSGKGAVRFTIQDPAVSESATEPTSEDASRALPLVLGLVLLILTVSFYQVDFYRQQKAKADALSEIPTTPMPEARNFSQSLAQQPSQEPKRDQQPEENQQQPQWQVNDPVEKAFLANTRKDQLRKFLNDYASVPHSAGSKQDYETAVYTAQQFEKYGIQAEIRAYYPLLSFPIRQNVSIVSPPSAARVLNLTEPVLDQDRTCDTSSSETLPPFLAYSASGDVTQSVVYVNYGTQQDFDHLASLKVDLTGRIALIRYGKIFRGLKVLLAQQHGMAGVLIYSDPAEDGFTRGEVYPNGRWRPEDSFQRGSAQFVSVYPGDPLTPGYASNADAPHLSVNQATSIPHIPATVLSYGQAKYILSALKGTKAPADWQGGLLISDGYYIGDDHGTQVRLDLDISNKIGPIWNVIGTIEGSLDKDQLVVLGTHRDAWVCGAVDPSSASAALLEIARGFGQLLTQGWKPRRTIKFASWDGEEYGLLGSTEYAEDLEKELTEKAVAYLNVDNIKGPLVYASGSPSIAEFLLDAAKFVPANNFDASPSFGQMTLFEQWKSQQALVSNKTATEVGAVHRRSLGPDNLVTLLGSGVDVTPFYSYLGLSSACLGFNLDMTQYGVYHSNMDTLQYVEKYGDPHFEAHLTQTRWWGLLALRLADWQVLPLDFSTYSVVMHDFLNDFQRQFKQRELLVNLAELRDAVHLFGANAELFQAQLRKFKERLSQPSSDPQQEAQLQETEREITYWNQKLIGLERELLSDEGLPHRKWYRHVVFGPGFYEGYSGVAFPGLADALAFNDSQELIQTHVEEIASLVTNAATFLVNDMQS